jgi:hypothetical protein
MTKKERLLQRLDAIGQSLANSGHGLALIGLGSAGSETERMDDYSDLDFFAIVEAGYKPHYMNDLTWLSNVSPIAYHFANTTDGYKLLYEDGIFCEMAVFEAEELAKIPFSSGRIIWKHRDFDDSDVLARHAKPDNSKSIEWLVGEAITCLYVGLGRYRRGEKLTAMRFIQGYAVDRVVQLAEHAETPQPSLVDGFMLERRVEKRLPQLAELLPQMTQGYTNSVESVLAILAYLEAHFPINATMKEEILTLAK